MKFSLKTVCSLLPFLLAAGCATRAHRPEGPYLGQPVPGSQAVLFAPGIISTGMDDRDITVSPDGDVIVYAVLEKPVYTLVMLRQINGAWQDHEIAPFSGRYNDYEPQFSPDGKRLYFCSERPAFETDSIADADIWYVEHNGDLWGEPVNVGAPVNTAMNEFYPSVTAEGHLYFTSHTMKIMCARFEGGCYQKPVQLSDSINTGPAYNASVSPDDQFIVFTSHSWGFQAGRGDLFVSHKQDNGQWGKARHLGYNVNSYGVDMCPSFSPDGKYLFFASNRTVEKDKPEPVTDYTLLIASANKPQNKKMDIYWVDSSVLK